jgi:PAS domain S-box-containing protein
MDSAFSPLDKLDDDVLLAFEMAPIGLLVSRSRVIQSYNQAFCNMFRYDPQSLRGTSLEHLYPSVGEFEHIGERALVAMRDHGTYSDERIMRSGRGELFWCHVTGRTLRRDDPFALAVWVFEDLSALRPVTANLTAREREIAQFLVCGMSSKQIAQKLQIGHRTIEAHRARLMRKYDVASTGELIAKLVGGH